MSTTEQAFVKAFARRNRVATSPAPQAASKGVASGGTTSNVTGRPAPHIDGLQVDRSVAETTTVYADPNDSSRRGPLADPIHRADRAESEIPAHHLNVAPVSPKSDSAPATDLANERPVTEDQIRTTEDMVQSTITIEQAFASLRHVHTAFASAAPTQLPKPPSTSDATSADQVPTIAKQEIDVPVIENPAAGFQTWESAEQVESVSPSNAYSDSIAAVKDSAPFRAVWEVDVFDVPTTVADLFFEGKLFQDLSDRLTEAVTGGLRSMLVTSSRPGEGRSTVAIGMAMAAAATGIRVALVDVDTEKPTLADDLRLDLRYGWVDTIRGGLPIKEVAVHALEDGLTLIPLMPPSGAAAGTDDVVQLIQMLKGKFDLLIMDGPANAVSLEPAISSMDSVVIVRDTRQSDATSVNALSYRLRESGVQGIGVVENFA